MTQEQNYLSWNRIPADNWQPTMVKFHSNSDFHLPQSQNCLLGCASLAESEHDTSFPIMDDYDRSLFWAYFIMIYHSLQWSIMEDNDWQHVAFYIYCQLFLFMIDCISYKFLLKFLLHFKFSANHDQSWRTIIGKIRFCWVGLLWRTKGGIDNCVLLTLYRCLYKWIHIGMDCSHTHWSGVYHSKHPSIPENIGRKIQCLHLYTPHHSWYIEIQFTDLFHKYLC